MRLIDADALIEHYEECCDSEWNKKSAPFSWADAFETVIDDIEDQRTEHIVEIGNCKGCIWANRKRPQKCSCCRRNPYMKDCYEVEI